MTICGECSFFIDVNNFPEMLNKPTWERIIKCEKGKLMDSLQYSCKLFKTERLVPPGGEHLKHKPKIVLNLRGGHIDSQSDTIESGACDTVNEDSGEDSPPLKLNLRKTVQPTLGEF